MARKPDRILQMTLPIVTTGVQRARQKGTAQKVPAGGSADNVGKVVRYKVPDFSDPNRPVTCLELGFPITAVNAVAANEGNASKPVYQMSKWWARRRSSVFRATLLAAAMKAPEDEASAAKQIWDAYYGNHQKAGGFRHLKVLDPFMGGGTTLVEGSRLGFQVYGKDLNPVAWFVVRNELAGTPADVVAAAFAEIERKVKPELMPFYTTTCPRGHQGRWLNVATGEPAPVDPLKLSPGERRNYRWEGPEIIYSFWAKHGPCVAQDCGHRTPVMRSLVVAQKTLTAQYLDLTCPLCGCQFHAELGETRIAPGAVHVVLDSEPAFSALSLPFARSLADYNQGNRDEKFARVYELLQRAESEPGLYCPKCHGFAGHRVLDVLRRHNQARKVADVRKTDFEIQSKRVTMTLLVSPEWVRGTARKQGDEVLGGYAGAQAAASEAWYIARLHNLYLIEVRGLHGSGGTASGESIADPDEFTDESDGLPPVITLPDGRMVHTQAGTTPDQGEFACQACGRPNNLLEALREFGHTAPVAPYAMQCFCPQCEAEGYSYGGRYFKAPDATDIAQLSAAEAEWQDRFQGDLREYVPETALPYTHMTRERNDLPGLGYTHWWKLFNSRQLLVHATLLKAIAELPAHRWPLDVREQVLGAFQQYLRTHNMFAFWHLKRDHIAPLLSNPHFHPKVNVVENNVFGPMGYGNWNSCAQGVVEGLQWCADPWETLMTPEGQTKSTKVKPGDPVQPAVELCCGSATDLSHWPDEHFDLVITDPPFGNNVFYADLADFFYVWLRIPLRKWYAGRPEAQYWEPESTPRALEAITNPAEHPDTRTDEEKQLRVPSPADEFYETTLTACWEEVKRVLKPGGTLAFTFHHSAHEPWVGVLQSLFDAGFVLMETYPIRSDESKGEGGAFGSKKIEYDILHVCRKRVEAPKRVSWAKMRSWVKQEVTQFRRVLEMNHTDLSPDDVRVMLYGKALQFYSEHYGEVCIGDEAISVRYALIGIEQLLSETEGDERRPPEGVEPLTGVFLTQFRDQSFMHRDDLHKRLRLMPVSVEDLEERGWVQETNKVVSVVPIRERFAFWRARRRDLLRTDLDQAHFLIGAAFPGSSVNIIEELNRHTFDLKPSVEAILGWYAEVDRDPEIRQAAAMAQRLVQNWKRDQQQKAKTEGLNAVQAKIWSYMDEEGGQS